MNNKKFLVIICTFCLMMLSTDAFARRVVKSINEGWSFKKETEKTYTTVSFPHTWNVSDISDETPGYFRGKGEYKRILMLDEVDFGKSISMYFEGAGQDTRLYVNGKEAGRHIGGYSAFCFDITPLLKIGENEIEIIVDNTPNKDIAPLSADFTFFGGIYRDVYLIITERCHISTTHFASSGVYITPNLSDNTGRVKIETYLSNDNDDSQKLFLRNIVYSPNGKVVHEQKERVKLHGSLQNQTHTTTFSIENPKIWDISSPELYRVFTKLENSHGEVLDEVQNSFGFRTFHFDSEKGFFLNGKHIKLIGSSRHQCLANKGNATPDAIHEADVMDLKKMGGNFLRISHYPQDPIVQQLCDKIGIITTVEIPIVNEITPSIQFAENCLQMAKEMIYQNFNSPSLTVWAYMNEVLLKMPYSKKQPVERKEYMKHVHDLAIKIESLVKEIDPSRYTMIPFHNDCNRYDECGLTSIPQILGWNIYKGWYGDVIEAFGKHMDLIHSRYPEKIIMLTEYGVDMDYRVHSFEQERFDFSCEYGMDYHKFYLNSILERDYIAASAVWNLNDFYSETRTDGIPRINNKGLSTIDREHKDSYHFYQSRLLHTPFIKIGGSHWQYRGGVVDSTGFCTQPVEIYSNADCVNVSFNGGEYESYPVIDGCVTCDGRFRDGENTITATCEKDGISKTDLLTFDFKAYPDSIDDNFDQLNVIMGTRRYYDDREDHLAWIPEKEYSNGSWGYVGGSVYRPKTSRGTVATIDIDVLGTNNDALWHTQRRDIEKFKADVPDGKYNIYLYFCEWNSSKEKEQLVNALGGAVIHSGLKENSFNVSVNERQVLKNFDIARNAGEQTALIKKITVDIENGEGLEISFEPVKGHTLLNAIRVVRVY